MGLGGMTITGNLINSCQKGIQIELCNWYKSKPMKSIVIQDNIFMNTGNGMNYLSGLPAAAIDLTWEAAQYAKTIEISDNVFLGCTRSLIRVPDPDVVQTNIHNNVFAQAPGQLLLIYGWDKPEFMP